MYMYIIRLKYSCYSRARWDVPRQTVSEGLHHYVAIEVYQANLHDSLLYYCTKIKNPITFPTVDSGRK